MLEIKTQAELEQVLKENDKVLLDFYADWCGPCKMLAPQLSELKAMNEDLEIVKINIEEAQELAGSYEVMSIPTMAFVHSNKLKGKTVGFQVAESISEWVNHLSK